MPVLHKYKGHDRYYVKSASKGMISTFQLLPQAVGLLIGSVEKKVNEVCLGMKDGDAFSVNILIRLIEFGWAYTRGQGPGIIVKSYKGKVEINTAELSIGDFLDYFMVSDISDLGERIDSIETILRRLSKVLRLPPDIFMDEEHLTSQINSSRIQVRLEFRLEGNDVGKLDAFAAECVRIFNSLNLSVLGPLPLPTRYESYKCISATRCKMYTISTMKRLIILLDPASGCIGEINRCLRTPDGIDIKIKERLVPIDY
jgi:ribosomal protein S10